MMLVLLRSIKTFFRVWPIFEVIGSFLSTFGSSCSFLALSPFESCIVIKVVEA
jgi:hypothetical protein